MEPSTTWIRCIVRAVIAVVGGFILASTAAAQPDRRPSQGIPPWKRPLTGDAASQVAKLEQRIAQLRQEGKFAEAIGPAREVAEIRTRLQGGDHWQTADARRAVDDCRTIAALPEEGRKALASVGDLEEKSDAEREHGHYADAERIDRTLLETRRKWLGEDHADTAASCNNIANNLHQQGKYAEAEPFHRTALAIYVKVLGEGRASAH
jgi:hypothetical protein